MLEQNEKQKNNKIKDVPSSVPFYTMCVFIIGLIGSGLYMNCGGKKEYKNIVVEVKKDKMLVRDICADKQERILTGRGMHNLSGYEYLVSGDTIIVREDKDLYKNKKVLYYPTIKYNRDSTWARQQRAQFNQIKDSLFTQQKQR